MINTAEIRGETIAQVVLPVGQCLGELACKMNATGIQPPIAQDIITGLEDLNSNNGQDATTANNDVDVLRPWALSLVFDLINTEGATDEYVQLVGADSPQARFMRHMADHHSAKPNAQDDIAKKVSSAQINSESTESSIMDPLFPSTVGMGTVAISMNAKGIQPIIDSEIIKDLTNKIKANNLEDGKIEDINVLRVISVVQIFGLLENTAKFNAFISQVGVDSPEARFMRHMAENYSPNPTVEHALIDKIQI